MVYRPLFGTMIAMMLVLPNNVPQKEKTSNYSVLRGQVDSVVSTIAGVLSREHAGAVFLKTGTRPVDEFVRQRLIEKLVTDKFRVLNDSVSASVVTISVPLVEVTYSAPVASHIFGPSDVVRTLRSEYEVAISDSEEVTYAKSFSIAFGDTVSENEIPDLESGTYDFLHGKIESRSFLNTVFQPALFIASAAVIVYLFFTLRGS